MPINPFADFSPTAFTVVITCADGLESALLTELTTFGLSGEQVRTGRVRVVVSLADFYRICLYSRVASRVLLPIGEYHFRQKSQTINQVRETNGKKVTRTVETKAIDEDVSNALYEFASRYDWTEMFGADDTFVVRLSVDKRLTVNQQFATLRIKDAVVDCFYKQLGRRPDVSKSPDFYVYAHATCELAELYLDLSGTSLHRRGYRVANTDAPLKENLTSALLYECNWHTSVHHAIIDPMCGSGTFLTEALLMRTQYPVGIDKKTHEFGFYAWRHHDESLWEQIANDALTNFHQQLESLEQAFTNGTFSALAMDASAHTIKACHKNLLASALAPIAHHVRLEQKTLAQAGAVLSAVCRHQNTDYPLIITNPPYGERLGESDFIKPLYQGLGLVMTDGLKQAGVRQADMAVLASHVEHADTLPIDDPKTLKCHNGALTVYFRHGRLDLSDEPSLIERFEKQSITHPIAQEFINRLQKNLGTLKKLATKQHVSNLRIYDADLPNYNVAIDVYGDKVHVQEYAPPKQIPTDVAKERFNLVLWAVREVLGVNRESVFIKTRAKQSGNEQYTKNPNADKKKKMNVVNEFGAYFYVNFTDYLDTGLFIDHRNIRQMIKHDSHHKKVLNLFAYTCSASVHAALGGVKSVVSVDLSDNYLTWGKENFALNGLDLSAKNLDETDKYQFIAADVFEWIKNHSEQYDVIFIDPPTFSNSKKFKGTFDVQRDHVALINRAMNRLAPNGVLYFSNNFSKFVLDDALKNRYEVECITDKTIGFDFNPKKPIHQSFKICHKNKSSAIIANDFDDNQNANKQTHQHDNKKAFGFKNDSNKSKQSFKEDKSKHDQSKHDGLNHKKPFKKDTVKKGNVKTENTKNMPAKPTQKIRYDKIGGKLVATLLAETASENHLQDTPKKYRIKKSDVKDK